MQKSEILCKFANTNNLSINKTITIMMRKFSYLLLMVFLSMSVAYAQELTSEQWKAILNSDQYLIGMGVNSELEEARQTALSDLSGKISTKVQSQFEYVLENKSKGQDVDSETKMKNIIRSYTSTTLKNISEHVEKEKDKYVVYRYIKNSELRAMFKRRINLAKKWAKEGIDREKEGKVGDALQDFYWSLALLRSCPDGDLETITQDYVEINMIQDVFKRVKDILSNIILKADEVEKDEEGQHITLSIKYKGKPAVNFNYRYAGSKGTSNMFSAKDGIGELYISQATKLSKLKIIAEYECREEANIHPDLRSVLETTEPVPFTAAEFFIDLKGSNVTEGFKQSNILNIESSVSTSESPHLATIKAIERGLAQRNYADLNIYFTSEGWEMFRKLIAYGDAKLLRSTEVQFLPDGQGVVCRSFPMSFTFRGNRRTFTEDVVFYMDNQAKVKEVAFGLEQAAVSDILGREQWSMEARQTMIHFLETYKTAYALKRLDYIESIFSQDALIITGSVVKGTGQKEMQPAKMAQVKYTRQTKEQYIKSLKKCFGSNEYINIRFAENTVRRSASKPDIYGIQIKQDYFSSSYGDTGYLFLLIDFQKPETPIIHVRTWQPDLDPNIKDGRIDITSFTL